MKLLLDTHALLWWLLEDGRLSARVRELIRSPETAVVVSAVSGLEIATKHRLGKLWTGSLDPGALPGVLRAERMEEMPITLDHGLAAGALPGPHRDPFDRILIAQSRIEGVPIATDDAVFEAYGAQTVW